MACPGAWLHLVNIVCNYIFPAALPAWALIIDRREHLVTTLLWSLLNIHDIQHPSPQCTLQSPLNRNAALSIVVSIMEVKTRSKFMYQRKGAQYHKHTCKQSTHTSSETGSREKEVIKETRQLVQVEEKQQADSVWYLCAVPSIPNRSQKCSTSTPTYPTMVVWQTKSPSLAPNPSQYIQT